jgi:hypothetical protein
MLLLSPTAPTTAEQSGLPTAHQPGNKPLPSRIYWTTPAPLFANNAQEKYSIGAACNRSSINLEEPGNMSDQQR